MTDMNINETLNAERGHRGTPTTDKEQTMKYTYTVTEYDDYQELLFDNPVDQESDEVDEVSDQIRQDLDVDPDRIDWRDDQTCWVWNEGVVI